MHQKRQCKIIVENRKINAVQNGEKFKIQREIHTQNYLGFLQGNSLIEGKKKK